MGTNWFAAVIADWPDGRYVIASVTNQADLDRGEGVLLQISSYDAAKASFCRTSNGRTGINFQPLPQRLHQGHFFYSR